LLSWLAFVCKPCLGSASNAHLLYDTGRTAELPSIGHVTVDLSSRDDGAVDSAVAAMATPMAPPSPMRKAGDGSAAPGSSAGPADLAARPQSATAASGSGGSGEGLDDYDPKEAAQREMDKIRKDIIAKRGESSAMRLELDRAVTQLEHARTELQQARSENNVVEQQRAGIAKLDKAAKELQAVTDDNDHESVYQLTLQHMVARMREDKIGHTKNMRLLEDALRVQKNELKLQKRLLRQATAARETEDTSLKSLLVKHQRMKRELDEKLEARAQEVALRKARKAEREIRLREEETLMARVGGDLTAKEEEELKRRVGKMKGEAKMAAQRLRFAVIKADKFEEEYNTVRVAAGATDAADGVEESIVSVAKDLEHDPRTLRYRPPNPKQVVHRFEVMQEEVADAEKQIADLSRRIAHLSHARSELHKALEPAAVDPLEETSFSREDRDALGQSADDAYRAIDSQRTEIARLRKLKVFLGQALDAIFSRIRHIAVDAPATKTKPLPATSPWAQDVCSKLHTTIERLLFVREEIDRAQGGKAVDAMADRSDHLTKSKQFEATIESVVTTNEMGVRIPTKAKSRAMNRQLGTKDFRTAAQQFSTTHSRVQRESRAAEKESEESEAARPSTGGTGSPGRGRSARPKSAMPAPKMSDSARESSRRKGPKPMEVTRYLAAAVMQTGQAVDEDILSSLADDADDAPDRARIKSRAVHELQARAALETSPDR